MQNNQGIKGYSSILRAATRLLLLTAATYVSYKGYAMFHEKIESMIPSLPEWAASVLAIILAVILFFAFMIAANWLVAMIVGIIKPIAPNVAEAGESAVYQTAITPARQTSTSIPNPKSSSAKPEVSERSSFFREAAMG
jgi:cytoskeletal protein RodZ